jgi:hypothetical protein
MDMGMGMGMGMGIGNYWAWLMAAICCACAMCVRCAMCDVPCAMRISNYLQLHCCNLQPNNLQPPAMPCHIHMSYITPVIDVICHIMPYNVINAIYGPYCALLVVGWLLPAARYVDTQDLPVYSSGHLRETRSCLLRFNRCANYWL